MNAKTLLLALVPIVAGLALLACDRARGSYQDGTEFDVPLPPDAERIELAMGDFCFYPQELHLPAGRTVQLVVRNLGNVRHELMAGRELGGHGYEQDFFAGLDVQATGDPRVFQWEAEAGDAHGEGSEQADAEGGHGHGGGSALAWSPEGETWDCEGQVMKRAGGIDYNHYAHMAPMDAGESAPTQDAVPMQDNAAMPDEAMSPHGEEEAAEEAATHGSEVWELNVDGFGTAFLTFTIPEDRKGEWEVGCFLPRHYERGMGATFIIE